MKSEVLPHIPLTLYSDTEKISSETGVFFILSSLFIKFPDLFKYESNSLPDPGTAFFSKSSNSLLIPYISSSFRFFLASIFFCCSTTELLFSMISVFSMFRSSAFLPKKRSSGFFIYLKFYSLYPPLQVFGLN